MAPLSNLLLQVLDLTHLSYFSYFLLLFVDLLHIWIYGFGCHRLYGWQLSHSVLFTYYILHCLLLEHHILPYFRCKQVLFCHLCTLALCEPRIDTVQLAHLEDLVFGEDRHVKQLFEGAH